MLCLRLACASLLAASAARGAVVLGTEFSGSPFGGFVDISQRLRRWVRAANTSQNAALDANGWPTEDAMTVVFDNRCFPGWNPPCDDPWSLQAPINGSYKLNASYTIKPRAPHASPPAASNGDPRPVR